MRWLLVAGLLAALNGAQAQTTQRGLFDTAPDVAGFTGFGTGGSGSVNTPVDATLTASGAINPAHHFVLLACGSTCAMTLANPATDGTQLTIKRAAASTATITLKLDGAAGAVVTLSASTFYDAVSLVGSTANNTWYAK